MGSTGRRRGARRSAGYLAALALAAAAAAAFVLWPRGPVYAEFVEAGRPTVVFVWSDPTPHHPHG